MSENGALPERSGRLQHLAANLRKLGLRGMAAKAIRDHVFRQELSFILARRTDDLPPADATPVPDGVKLVELTRGDAVPPLSGWLAHRRADFAGLLEDGRIGMFALADGQAIACIWASTEDFHDPNSRLFVTVPEGEAYAFGMMVDHQHRDCSVARLLAAFGLRQMNARAVTRVFNYCDIGNETSYRAQAGIGFEETGELMVETRLFGLNLQSRRRYRGSRVPPAWNRPRLRRG